MIQKRFQGQSWYKKEFEGTAYTLHQWQVLGRIQKNDPFFTKRFHESFTITENNRVHWFWVRRDLLAVRSWFLDHLKRDARFPKKLIARWRRALHPVIPLLRKWATGDLRALSDEELIGAQNAWYEQYLRAAAIAVMLEGFSLEAERWFRDLFYDFLKKRGKETLCSEYFSLLTQSTRPSFIQQAVLAKAKGMSPSELARRFYWIHYNYLHTKPLTASYFTRMHVEHLPDFRVFALRKKKIMNALHLPLLLRRIFSATDIFTWWQDQRKKYALLATEVLLRFLHEAGRRQYIAESHLLRMIPPEFEKLARGDRAFIRELTARNDPFFVYVDDSHTFVCAGKKAKQLSALVLKAEKAKEVRGASTFLGKARGKVVCILRAKDMNRFCRGDILVTSMTRPEYTPILRKAGAIVTDEGGITSHAAIISREFRIPCVIGTKIATKVFKDGDRVEVDATAGIVRKI